MTPHKHCKKHSVNYNGDEPECPLCATERVVGDRLNPPPVEPEEKKERASGWSLLFTCLQCGRRAAREGICARYECRKSAGLDAYGSPNATMLKYKCGQCGGRTRNESQICSSFKCWKKAGRAKEWYARYVKSGRVREHQDMRA